MNRNETVKGLDRNTPLPRGNYVIRCTEEKFGESSKGNMMITREFEIVEPGMVKVNGVEVNVAGTTLTQYLTTKVFKEDKSVDEYKTKKAMGNVFADYEKIGHPCDEIDENNPLANCSTKGMLLDAVCSSAEYDEKDSSGNPILDRNTNKPLKGYQVKISSILGVSSFKPAQ